MDRLLRAVLQPASRKAAGECPDAATLAALVEGSLTPAEQSVLDSHVVDCGRCQEALAVMSHELQGEEEAALETGWFTWVTRPRLRWFVPIGAAATVVVVFLATRPLIAPEGEVPAAEVVQLAQAPPRPAEVPADELSTRRERSAAAPEKSEFAGAARRDDAAKSVVRQAPAPKEAREAVGDAALAGQFARDKKPVEPAAEMMDARVTLEEKRAQPAAPQAAVSPAAADVPAMGGAATKLPAADAMRAAPMPVAAPSMRKELGRVEPAAIVTAGTDRTVRWRLGPGGQIWRSLDAGSTWHWQLSGVSADLVAGSAPSATTCWAVGAAGTVLLTTDGERWTLLPFPVAADLAAVQATNTRTATVTTRDGRRFETLDAGLTWSLKQ
jgi:hypothetical protein